MKKIIVTLFILIILVVSCSKEKDGELVDREKPTIDVSKSIFKGCAQVKKGLPFTFTADFKDNVALAAYSIDIHHNFDHHTHSTEAALNECTLQPIKQAKNPFKITKVYKIGGGLNSFQATQEFIIPKEFESGNYHFMVKVTDHEGWTTLKGLSFEVID